MVDLVRLDYHLLGLFTWNIRYLGRQNKYFAAQRKAALRHRDGLCKQGADQKQRVLILGRSDSSPLYLVGMGWVPSGHQLPHPHPNPPLEGEGITTPISLRKREQRSMKGTFTGIKTCRNDGRFESWEPVYQQLLNP